MVIMKNKNVKPVYEAPKVFRLNETDSIFGQACDPVGSNPANGCRQGNKNDTGGCINGNTNVTIDCNNGNNNVGGNCTSGGAPTLILP